MSFDINSSDVQCALRSKNPVMVGDVPVNHVSFAKISSIGIGFAYYNQMLGYLCMSKEQSEKIFKNVELPSVLTGICASALNDATYRNLLTDACVLFFGKKPYLDEKYARILFLSDTKPATLEFEINETNFSDVVDVIKKRNGITPPEEEEWGNPASSKAKAIIARRNELRKKRKKDVANDDGLTLWDLIDIFASIMKMTYSDVMEYDVYQLNTQFTRMRMYDEYHVNIEYLVHGAKEINCKHWIRKIDKKQDDD